MIQEGVIAGTKLKPGRKKSVKDKHMLEGLMAKYKPKDSDIEEVVYRLSFAKKFITVKGKTLYGSLLIISDTFDYFTKDKSRYDKHLYVNLYNHYIRHRHMRFTIRILAKKDLKTSQFKLLKREQMELDKHKNNPSCLNNTKMAYIPQYNGKTHKYGWLERENVLLFTDWFDSKERKAYIKRYCSPQS